jgi:O-antigen/teichoic acid export membrane protein
MTYATQRFFSVEIGQGNTERLNLTFNVSFCIYLLISVLVIVLAETAGLWFINNILLIPPLRMGAAQWIYQCSIISFVLTLLITPYTALIIAHEDMNIYAILSIIKAFFDLGCVILLQFILWDKLKLYGLLLCIFSFIFAVLYISICTIKYQNIKVRLQGDKKLFREITSYTGWSFFVAFAGICKNQVVIILLNQYFNPMVVVTRSIAASVNGAVSSFFDSFNTAIKPPIVKSYAAGKSD